MKELVKYLDDVDLKAWPDEGVKTKVSAWRRSVPELAALFKQLDNGEERFAILQQASSLLRTSLTYDVESRLR